MKTPACFRLFVASLALVLAPLTAIAAGPGTPPTYTDEASFLSQIVAGTAVDGDFNDLTQGFVLSSPLATRTVGAYAYDASTGDGSSFFIEGTNPPLDTYLSTVNTNTSINFAVSTGGNPVEAFGGQFFALDNSGNFVAREVTVTANGGALSITKTPASIADSFFGFIVGTDATGTSGGITTIEVSIGSTANTFAASNSVTFAVPEPSTYALLAMAATTGGLCQLRRRRKLAA